MVNISSDYIIVLHTAVLNTQAAAEVENMKSQMMTLFKELQQAQSKLDEAEGMKKNLQDRLDLLSALANGTM